MEETNNTESTQDMDEMRIPTEFSEEHHSHIGPILGVLIILLVIILGGLYLWGGMLDSGLKDAETPLVNDEPETVRAKADLEMFRTTSPSDEIDAIEADLESTNFELLDVDMNAIDAELNTALTE